MKNYIIKKYVTAETALDAINKEKEYPVIEVLLDEATQTEYRMADAIGFSVNREPDVEYEDF